LINPHTQAPHQCNPKDIIITEGKWRGYSRGESAAISIHVEETYAKYLASLREKFKSPYEKETDVL
jgi:hypothetical protein